MDTDTTHTMVESFQDLDGRSLLQMTPEDFRGISEEHGQFIYEIFKQMYTVGKYIIYSYDFNYFLFENYKNMFVTSSLLTVKKKNNADHMFKMRCTMCW